MKSTVLDGHKPNFDTIERACREGRLALLDCRNRATGEPEAVVVALSGPDDDGEVTIVPLARMFQGNPYDELDPPDPDGGYVSSQFVERARRRER